MLTAKELKEFLQTIPDDATVIFNPTHIMFWHNHNVRGINKWGAIWDNGIGYLPKSPNCGECSHFQCDICNGYAKGQ